MLLLLFVQPAFSERPMSTNATSNKRTPYMIAGAGELISHVKRHQLEPDEHSYQFNLFRICDSGEATSWLRPEDLRDVVKACQVLAFLIADDGGVETTFHDQLVELAGQLQIITDSWERNNG